EGVGAALLVGLTRRRFLGGQAFEIIPVAVVFGRMRLAELPALRAVRRFRRGPVARLLAAVPVAQPHGLGLPAGAVAPPAGKAPIVRSLLTRHVAPEVGLEILFVTRKILFVTPDLIRGPPFPSGVGKEDGSHCQVAMSPGHGDLTIKSGMTIHT